MKVFVAVNSESTRDRMDRWFSERLDAWVMTGDSIYDALTTLPDFIPDVVVLDIELPDGSGFDLLNLIKREWPHIQVFFHSRVGIYGEGGAVGENDFIRGIPQGFSPVAMRS